MKTGICTLPLIPLRSEPSERSEMTSQILFGELVEVMEESGPWSLVRIFSDNYTGWCTRKMLQLLPQSALVTLNDTQPVLTQELLTSCIKQGETCPNLFLPAGSRLYLFDPKSGVFPVFKSNPIGNVELEHELWSVNPASILTSSVFSMNPQGEKIVNSAFTFLNAPYLWGGKSILGIDCSGLTQVVFSLAGLNLPRDASDQALLGERIPVLSNSRAGDLAFFSNAEGKIVHVGILTGGGKIIHSSGCVHVDCVDKEGIFSESLGCYTHQLHSVKRLIPAI